MGELINESVSLRIGIYQGFDMLTCISAKCISDFHQKVSFLSETVSSGLCRSTWAVMILCGAFKVVPYGIWRSNFVLTILAVWQIGGHSFSAVWKALKAIFLSIGQIVGKLELPPLNMNTKPFSLYGTTLRPPMVKATTMR